jgi:hypothetical protein
MDEISPIEIADGDTRAGQKPPRGTVDRMKLAGIRQS